MTFATYSHPEDRPPAAATEAPAAAPKLRPNLHLVVGRVEQACVAKARRISARHNEDVLVTRHFVAAHRTRPGKVVVLCRSIEPIAGQGYVLHYHDGRSGVALSDGVVAISYTDRGDDA